MTHFLLECILAGLLLLPFITAQDTIIGIVRPSDFAKSPTLRQIYTTNGTLTPWEVPIELPSSASYLSTAAYDQNTSMYAYSWYTGLPTVFVTDINVNKTTSLTLPCSPTCTLVSILTGYEGNFYGIASGNTTALNSTGLDYVSNIYVFSFDPQTLRIRYGFWYSIPPPYVFLPGWPTNIAPYAAAVGVSIIDGQERIYLILAAASQVDNTTLTFGYISTIHLKTQNVTIQDQYIRSNYEEFVCAGKKYYDYFNGSIWCVNSYSIGYVEIGPVFPLYSSIYYSFTGVASPTFSSFDLKNGYFYYVAAPIIDNSTVFLSRFDLTSSQLTRYPGSTDFISLMLYAEIVGY